MVFEKKNHFLQFILLFVFLSLSRSIFADVYNVNDTSDVMDFLPGDGVCETATGNGICTLRAALAEANAWVFVRSTINLPAANYNITSSLSITSGLSLIGENTATTIIDANNTARVINISTSLPVTITDLTIQGGNAGTAESGGGILIKNSWHFLNPGTDNFTLTNLNINNNRAYSGAGIDAYSFNTLTITNSVIENNIGLANGTWGAWGGGLHLADAEDVYLINSTVRNNSAGIGGGVFFQLLTLYLNNSTVSDNVATPIGSELRGGGGIVIGSGGPGVLHAVNSTISGNKASDYGAGIVIQNGTAYISNTTITNNIADINNNGKGFGGGIIAPANYFVDRILKIKNSIVADNKSMNGGTPDCGALILTVQSSGYNIIGGNSSCDFVASESDQVGSFSSLLGPLANNGGPTQTHAILPNSPAIDSGNPSGCSDYFGTMLSTDQRGNPRPIDGNGNGSDICDSGAYETNTLPSVNVVLIKKLIWVNVYNSMVVQVIHSVVYQLIIG